MTPIDPPTGLAFRDPARLTDQITEAVRSLLAEQLKRRGLVVAMSGGVDSSVCAGLAVRAVGADRVFGLFLPERDSDPRSLAIAGEWAGILGIESRAEDIAPILEAAGCYERRDEAIRRAVPEYGPGWRCKLAIPGGARPGALNVTQLVVQPPDGAARHIRLGATEYRQIVAATNFKQRVRKMLEYYHADRLHYAVVGTPNRLEYDQGFFVKGGDGLADLKPIAHLYKTEVYALAAYLGVPRSVTDRPSTTDTFSLPQTQEEFYFSAPTRVLDLVLRARNMGRPVAQAAGECGLEPALVEALYRDIDQKRMTTAYLHMTSLVVEDIPLGLGRQPG